MIRIAKGDRAYCEAFIQSLKARVSENDRSVEDKVAEILKDVRDNGDEAVRRYTMKFDGWAPEKACLLYTSPSPRDGLLSRMPSSA